MPTDHTHDPSAQSWLGSANGHNSFPIQNLPFAVFRRQYSDEAWRGGVAIGDDVLDLAALAASGALNGLAQQAAAAAAQPALNALLALGRPAWTALRHALFALLQESASADTQDVVTGCLVSQYEVEYTVPTRIGDYTDFYTSIHHARNVGRVIRPDDPLTPNFQWLPIAYHGRASSVVISGTAFRRPMGQGLPPGTNVPVYGPCRRLDFELEMGFYVGPGNALGQPIPLTQAEQHIFGLCLLNDWSARDHQFWEMAPLGPFLGKNFCTSVSPWIVTLDALEPFRVPAVARGADEPQPLAYLDSADNRARGGVDVQLSVAIENERHAARYLPASEIARTSLRYQYWTIGQMLTQHTVGGCNLNPGDLLGTGTISGPTPDQSGAIVELSRGGTTPITLQQTGEPRTFLEDGDTVILSGWCEAPGVVRIGFGECRGTVLPALQG